MTFRSGFHSQGAPAAAHRAVASLLAWVLTALLRLQWVSWRRRIEGAERLRSLDCAGRRPLVVFWHGKYAAIFPFFKGEDACVFTSRSFRGSVIAGICSRFGYRAVFLPERSGAGALELMRRSLQASAAGAVAVDGPLGPRHVAKAGPVLLASELGFVLLPVSTVARRRMVLRKRWDFMEVPLPFTRVALVVGEALKIPSGLRREDVGPWISRLEQALAMVERRAEALVAPDFDVKGSEGAGGLRS